MRLPKCSGSLPDIYTPSVIVESPGYVYITVRINKSPALRNVYWHLVDPIFSLLELGFEWDSRRLTHISIPLYKGRINHVEDALPKQENGEPIFELANLGFSADYRGAAPEVVKEEGRIQLNRSGPDLHIRLGTGDIQRAFSCQQRVVYGFGEDGELKLICLPAKASLLK